MLGVCGGFLSWIVLIQDLIPYSVLLHFRTDELICFVETRTTSKENSAYGALG